MWWPSKSNIEKAIVIITKSRDVDNKVFLKLVRNRRTSVPLLVKTLKSSIFDADHWVDYADSAAQILVLLAQADHKTEQVVIKHLIKAAHSKEKYRISPDWVLKNIGVPLD